MAFWINAYNAVVMWQVVERYPLDSVRDVGTLWGLVGGFFKQEYPIAGGDMSADDIEHATLREKFDILLCGKPHISLLTLSVVVYVGEDKEIVLLLHVIRRVG